MYLGIRQPGSLSTSAQETKLGTPYRDPYGRTFHYAEAGGTLLTRGRIAVSATQEANHINLSWQTVPAVGDREARVTLGATAAALDLYKDGWMVVQDNTEEGRAYPIEGHPAASSSGTIILTLNEAMDTAGTASAVNVDLVKNLYKDIVISVTDQEDVPAGVPIRNITADQFGWVQTWGPCAVWRDEATVAGEALTIGTGTAGQVELLDNTADTGEHELGWGGPVAGVDTEYQLTFLRLEP